MDDPNPLANLDYQGPPALLAETIDNFFAEVSSHLPKIDPTILANLRDDHNADFTLRNWKSACLNKHLQCSGAWWSTELVPAGLRAISVSSTRGNC